MAILKSNFTRQSILSGFGGLTQKNTFDSVQRIMSSHYAVRIHGFSEVEELQYIC